MIMREAKSRLATAPLAVAYMAIPVGTFIVHLMGAKPQASPFFPWLLLAGLGTMWAILVRRSSVRVKKRFAFEALMFAALVVGLLANRQSLLRQSMEAGAVIAEFTPAIMLFFCGLWVMTFGTPDRRAFQRYGGVLGAFCVIDLSVEAVFLNTVPFERWIGNADMLAGLLLVALCASLRPGGNDGGPVEPDEGASVWRALILMGLAATLSRTGLFGAAWIFLCFGRGTRKIRAGIAFLFFLFIAGTFLLPVTPADAFRYVDYWLWAKSVDLFAREPVLLLKGLPFLQALPFKFPPGMVGLWEVVTGVPSFFGAHLSQVSPFWLRLLLAWGVLVPLVGVTALCVLLSRRVTRMGAGLIAALFVQGMSTPLFYDPTMGTVYGLAFFLAFSAPVRGPDRRTVTSPPATASKQASKTEPDPVTEWDMRPL